MNKSLFFLLLFSFSTSAFALFPIENDWTKHHLQDVYKRQFFALHDHNEQEKAHVLVEKLKQGTNIALISDAGTPLISDPGFHLVRQCREAGIKVVLNGNTGSYHIHMIGL